MTERPSEARRWMPCPGDMPRFTPRHDAERVAIEKFNEPPRFVPGQAVRFTHPHEAKGATTIKDVDLRVWDYPFWQYQAASDGRWYAAEYFEATMTDAMNMIVTSVMIEIDKVSPAGVTATARSTLVDDLHLDSLDRVELAINLERSGVAVMITDDDIDAWTTVQDVIDTVARKQGVKS